VASDRDDERLAAPGDLELIRDFVNTLDVLPGTEEIYTPNSLAHWLEEHGLLPTTPTLDEEDLTRARRLREALRAFLRANADLPLTPEAVEAFDAATNPVRLRARADDAGRLELFPAEAGALDHAIGRLVAIVFAAQQDGMWSRLKVCAECQWALYDHTKNRSAAWCGAQCGTRARSRRYRVRHRESTL